MPVLTFANPVVTAVSRYSDTEHSDILVIKMTPADPNPLGWGLVIFLYKDTTRYLVKICMPILITRVNFGLVSDPERGEGEYFQAFYVTKSPKTRPKYECDYT